MSERKVEQVLETLVDLEFNKRMNVSVGECLSLGTIPLTMSLNLTHVLSSLRNVVTQQLETYFHIYKYVFKECYFHFIFFLY